MLKSNTIFLTLKIYKAVGNISRVIGLLGSPKCFVVFLRILSYGEKCLEHAFLSVESTLRCAMLTLYPHLVISNNAEPPRCIRHDPRLLGRTLQEVVDLSNVSILDP